MWCGVIIDRTSTVFHHVLILFFSLPSFPQELKDRNDELTAEVEELMQQLTMMHRRDPRHHGDQVTSERAGSLRAECAEQDGGHDSDGQTGA